MTRIGVAVAAFVAAGAALAQPPEMPRPVAPPTAPLITRLSSHLADPALVEELKLTPDQVKALAPAGAKKGGTNPFAPKGGMPMAEAPKVEAPAVEVPKGGTPKAEAPKGDPPAVARAKAVLTPEQYARAVQLMAQDALRTGRGTVVTPAALAAVPAAVLHRHPELADAARLTREQKRRVTAAAVAAAPNPNFGRAEPTPTAYGGLPGAAHIVLEPEQTAALAAFVGPLRTAPFAPAAPGTMPTNPGVSRPVPNATFLQPAQRAMLAVNNRGELKLTDEQVTTLTGLMNQGRVTYQPDGTPMPPRPTTPAETEAALAKALTAPQQTRLKQIELWQQVPAGADATAKFDLPRVASQLDLSDEQKADLKALGQAHREKAAAALDTIDSAPALKAALAAARDEVTAGVGKLLTEEQGAKLVGLFGPEYRGAGAGGPGTDIYRRIRAAGYGNYQFELMVVNSGRFGGVAEDLRLTEEQKTALTAAEAAFNQQFSQAGFNYEGPEKELAKQMSDRSKAMGKIFDDHFTADQKKRFGELCIQLRQQLTAQQAGGGAYPATGAPGVADRLKLTPEQRTRIIDTGEEDEVLTAAQRAELTRLAGAPLAGGFNFGGPARGKAAPPSARLALLHAGGAHADLGLDADQTRLIAAVIEAHAAELRPAPAGHNPELGGYVEPPAGEVVEDTVKACEKACAAVLTPPQRDRLGQLILQSAAHTSLVAVFARPEVTEKLGFTPEQRAALDEIATDYRTRVGYATALPSTAGWPELRQKALVGMRERARDRLLGVLTEPQAAAWRELTGAACPAVAAATPPVAPGRDP